MTLAQIQYLWWIEHKNYEDPEYLTLTWSATIATFKSDLKNISVLIDYWMFQGGRDDEFANSTVDQQALDTNCIVLTHAHLDHAGRIPLLVKNGYDKPIYMTSITAQKIYVMLEDYISIMEEQHEIAVNNFKKVRNKASGFLYAIEAEQKLRENGLSKQDQAEIKGNLVKFYWENYNINEIIKNAWAFQAEFWIYSQEDLQKKYNEIPPVLYDRNNLSDTMKLIKVLDYGNSTDLNNTFFVDNFSEDNLKKLIKKVYEGSQETIYIDSPVFPEFMKAINQRIKTTKLAERKNIEIRQTNEAIDDEYAPYREKIENMLFFLSNTLEEEGPELHHKYTKTLEKEWITSQEDLEELIVSKKTDLYDIKYSSTILEKMRGLLQIKVKTWEEKNKNQMKSLQLQLIDAGHIEWSAQALFSVVSEKINTILEKPSKKASPLDMFARKAVEHKNFLFSWDLWRRKDPNISGTWKTSPYKLDFLQIETTYAGRNHPNRAKEEGKFMDTINQAEGKIIIPAFSMQRTQEVAILLLEKMESHIWDLEKLEEYKQDLTYLNEQLEWVEDQQSREAKMHQENIKCLKAEIHRLKTTSPVFWNIILNSPLWSKITGIYMQNLPWKYKLLDPQEQEKIFGRVVVQEITKGEDVEQLYTPKRKNRKEIVISASGMCTWGFIQSHLVEALQNPKSTVLFTWYCPPNSPGWRIKQNLPVYLTSETNEPIQPVCKIVDNKAFSGHLDHEEVLMYIQDLKDNWKLARNAIISLNHGWEKREEIRVDMMEEVLKTKRNVKILIPQLWDTIEIKC